MKKARLGKSREELARELPMRAYGRAIRRILNAKTYKGKTAEWAEEQLDRALRNTDGKVSAQLIKHVLKEEFGI